MKPRQKRMLWVLAGVVLVGLAVTLVLRALDANVMFSIAPVRCGRAKCRKGLRFALAVWWKRAHCSALPMACRCSLW